MIGTMRFSVDRERAGSANTLAAIGVERDWLLAASEQDFVQDVEHSEKRSVRRNAARVVIDEFARRLRVRLSPDSQVEVHFCNNELPLESLATAEREDAGQTRRLRRARHFAEHFVSRNARHPERNPARTRRGANRVRLRLPRGYLRNLRAHDQRRSAWSRSSWRGL